MTIRAWAIRRGDAELFRPEVDALADLLADPEVRLWVDITEAGTAEERLLAQEFGFQDLVIEDVFEEALPKIEDHGRYLYLIVHGVDPARADPHDLATHEIDLFLGERFVLTHHSQPNGSIEAMRARLEREPTLLADSPAYVIHGVLDHMVDAYIPVMEQFDEVVDALEIEIVTDPRKDLLQRIFDLKRSLQQIRRIGMHQREILARLESGRYRLVPDATVPFFSDVYDHFVRVTDLADSDRELVTAALDAHLSVQSNRMNEVMKLLTVIATIFLPLTFITGLYGMNFAHMPELEWDWGYVYVWVVMVLTAGGMLFFFNRRNLL